MFEYPLTGFHFLVTFELFPQVPNDLRFQEVTGLTVDVNLETYNEGGRTASFTGFRDATNMPTSC